MSSFRKSIPRITRAAGTVVNGIFTDGTEASSTIKASVQPFMPHEMQHLPEGRRNSKAYWIFTDTKLNLVGSANQDLVTIDSEDYEVVMAAPWQNGVIPHYRYAVTKEIES